MLKSIFQKFAIVDKFSFFLNSSTMLVGPDTAKYLCLLHSALTALKPLSAKGLRLRT
jgi:hypothetical protein